MDCAEEPWTIQASHSDKPQFLMIGICSMLMRKKHSQDRRRTKINNFVIWKTACKVTRQSLQLSDLILQTSRNGLC
jgi:hypothetical protein